MDFSQSTNSDGAKDALSHALQENFRQILEAYSRPGSVIALPHHEHPAALQFLVNVLDESVSFLDHHQQLSVKQGRYLQAKTASIAEAQFIYLDGKQPSESNFHPALGSLSSPELSASLVIEVSHLNDTPSNCSVLSLEGPGIQNEKTITVKGLHPDWLRLRAQWVSHFPLGLEFVLCAGDKLLVLTRTTKVTIKESEAWPM